MTALAIGDLDDTRTAVRRALATAHIAPVTEEQLEVVLDVLRLRLEDENEKRIADGIDKGAVAEYEAGREIGHDEGWAACLEALTEMAEASK